MVMQEIRPTAKGCPRCMRQLVHITATERLSDWVIGVEEYLLCKKGCRTYVPIANYTAPLCLGKTEVQLPIL